MNSDSFHRLMKLLVDSEEVKTLEEAVSTFARYGVRIELDVSVLRSIPEQVIALTAINTAARSFQGNVLLTGPEELVLAAPGFEGVQMQTFATWAGVNPGCTPMPSWPVIRIGTGTDTASASSLHPWAAGWTFGIRGHPVTSADFFAPACVAAGALAVSEAFSVLRRDNPYAGRRSIKFSLWSMDASDGQPPPGTSVALADDVWLVGLGHLGQAYCWTIGMMEKHPSLRLYLQDVDIVTKSTLSTSVLASPDDLGRKKTRTVATWLEARGFDTQLIERRFDAATRIGAGEPSIALFGVDNVSARRCCEQAGFSLVLDAGLGAGYRDFRALRVRAFPGASSAERLWAQAAEGFNAPVAAAYKTLLANGADPCGVTTLATRAVGAPFVGCYAAAVVLAELQRRKISGRGRDVIDVSLRTPEVAEVS